MIRLILLLVFLTGAASARADSVTVFAAASLKTALDQIAAQYTAATGTDIVPVYAASSVLARQIALGAPADIFVSASADWMDWVASQDALAPATRRDIATNSLVLIAHGAGAPHSTTLPDIAALLNEGRLAVALINAVPAGIYAKAALDWAGAPDDLPLAQSANVRAALALVARGETPLGIVYASDAVAEPRVSVVFRFPAAAHPPIVYPAAAMRDASPAGLAFLDHLASPAARAAFAQNGFQ